jgi:hypothetical protein
MNYTVKWGDEAAWLALQTAAAGLVTAIATELGADVQFAATIGIFTSTLLRVVIGQFLPSPSETGGA